MNTNLTRKGWLWLLVALCCWGVSGDAWAETFAEVTAISEPDTRGRWRPVKISPAAAKMEDGVRRPLTVGMALSKGDRIVTEEARVTVRLARREHITISPASDLVIEERTVIQKLGEVYYQVRDVFSVQYGTVQTAVEGTEFAVVGKDGAEGPVSVAVTEGAVQVSNAGQAVRVKRGQEVLVAPALAPGLPTKMPLAATQAARSNAWTLGRPQLQVGALASGSVYGDEAGIDLRYFAALRVLPFLNVVADGAQGFTPDSLRTGSGLGLEVVMGGLSVGGSGSVTLERWRYACGGQYAALHMGGHVHGRYTLDITRRFFVAAMARAGGNGDGFEATVGLGGGVSL